MMWNSSKHGVTLTLAWCELRSIYRLVKRGTIGGFWRAMLGDILNERRHYDKD